jgi:hypothetical protein
MVYTQIENGQAKYPFISLETLVLEGVIESVDATQEELAAANVVPVTRFTGQIPNDGYKYEAKTLRQPDGSWAQELLQVPISGAEYQTNFANVVRAMKDGRNAMLRDCDWTQAADVNLPNKAAWATYRQALRDVPNQPGFPFNVVWPTIPEQV